MNQTDFILIGAFVFASIMSVADLTNAFGETDINPQVENLTAQFEAIGFCCFDLNQETGKITVSGYYDNITITNETRLAEVSTQIMEQNNFTVIDTNFPANDYNNESDGGYVVAVHNDKLGFYFASEQYQQNLRLLK